MSGLGFGLMVASVGAFFHAWTYRDLVRATERTPWGEAQLEEARRMRDGTRLSLTRRVFLARLRVEEDHDHGRRMVRLGLWLGLALFSAGLALFLLG